MTLTEAQKAEIEEILHNYGTAYQKKDINALLALFSPEITGFGSGPDEIVLNRKDVARQMKRDLSQATSILIAFPGVKIFGDGRVAWGTSGCDFSFIVDGGRKQTMCGRMTMVLRNTGGRWLIEQMHFSMPYGEQTPGQSFPGA